MIKIGDHVRVKDESLEKLTEIARKYGQVPEVPNNTGIVDDIKGEIAYIIFDDNEQCAPYYLDECTVL